MSNRCSCGMNLLVLSDYQKTRHYVGRYTGSEHDRIAMYHLKLVLEIATDA